MILSQSNVGDIKKYFLNTYVKFKEEGDKIFYVKHVGSDKLTVHDVAGEEALLEYGPDFGDYTMEYVLPRKTIFQRDNEAVSLTRVPARMWKKGLNEENTQFAKLIATGWSKITFDIHTIDSFVNKPIYLSFTEAVARFELETFNSAALTPRISMNKKGSVYIDGVLVGRFSFVKSELLCKEIYVPELSKVFECKVKAIK